jgi:4-hydroxy-tetrahydrodipicolinate reductase
MSSSTTSAARSQGERVAGAHVVGSSGLSAGNYAELDRLARDRGVGVVAAGNFSIMAAILKRAAALPCTRPTRG